MTWFALIFCLAASFLVSGTEAGILSLNRLRLRHLARQKDRAAVQLQQLLERPARLLVTALVITSLLNIVALVLLVNILVGWFGWPGYFLTFVLGLPLFLLVVELLPKAIFRRVPYRELASLAVLLDIASMVLTPAIYVGSLFAKSVLGFQRPREIFVAREDLKYITSEVERMGMLSSIERQMIHNVVDFRSVKVSDVMISLSKIVTVRPETPVEQLIELSRRSGFDRYPVVDSAGKIVGLVNVFEVLVDRESASTVRQYLRRILTVRSDEQASIVLRRLRASLSSVAAVVDAEGRPIGIVSAEDLLNPLVRVDR
ncbi:MAG TPA: CNNM domain-containing protein [Chthoniobacterales bacterium]|jgi:CBS domain containing-hemolysin-like protein